MSIRTGIYVRVSTDDQRDNGFSIDSQLRMLKEYCEKNNYDIIDVYDDGGYSGKDLMRPAMQKLLKDIKEHKLDKLVAIKTDRLTRNNYDGFWLLNYCEQHDVKIELTLEPYDISTANGEMMFGMNLVFGQRERKEIGARTKRALDEMALEKVHPAKAPFGYTRNKETGHLEINPLEAISVKRAFELCELGKSIRSIAQTLTKEHAYLNCHNGVWLTSRVEKLLDNKIYIGILEYGKYKRKKQDILVVENYCEPIIDKDTWNATRRTLIKNKHSNHGQFVHIFASLVKCPECGKILSSSQSYKYTNNGKLIRFHLRCKNPNCSGYGHHYNCNKIEDKLIRILDELTRYMVDMKNELIVANTSSNKEIEEINKAISKLEDQEKKLVDLYVESTLNVNVINQKHEKIKKDIEALKIKKESLDPENISKDYVVELVKKYNYEVKDKSIIFPDNLEFSFMWKSLNKESQRLLINSIISSIEIKRNANYDIEITNIKFTEQFINKNPNEYIEYLYSLLRNQNIGIIYQNKIDEQEISEYEKKYSIISLTKMFNNEYSKEEKNNYLTLIKNHFYIDGIIARPLTRKNVFIDNLIMVPKELLH